MKSGKFCQNRACQRINSDEEKLWYHLCLSIPPRWHKYYLILGLNSLLRVTSNKIGSYQLTYHLIFRLSSGANVPSAKCWAAPSGEMFKMFSLRSKKLDAIEALNILKCWPICDRWSVAWLVICHWQLVWSSLSSLPEVRSPGWDNFHSCLTRIVLSDFYV